MARFSPWLLLLLLPLCSESMQTRMEFLLEIEDDSWMLYGLVLVSILALAFVLYLDLTRQRDLRGLPQESVTVVLQLTQGQCTNRALVVSVQPSQCQLDREAALQETRAHPGTSGKPTSENPSAERREGPRRKQR